MRNAGWGKGRGCERDDGRILFVLHEMAEEEIDLVDRQIRQVGRNVAIHGRQHPRAGAVFPFEACP